MKLVLSLSALAVLLTFLGGWTFSQGVAYPKSISNRCKAFTVPRATCDDDGNTVPSDKELACGTGNETYLIENTDGSIPLYVYIADAGGGGSITCLEDGEPQFFTIGAGDKMYGRNYSKAAKARGTIKPQ